MVSHRLSSPTRNGNSDISLKGMLVNSNQVWLKLQLGSWLPTFWLDS